MTHFQYRRTTIHENVPLADKIFRVRLEAPEIAQAILPGQFVMLRLADFLDPLLGRALALYDVVRDDAGQPWGIDVVYKVEGKFTSRLSRFDSGQALAVWGPLGNGFSRREVDHLILVAGGIGQTPFLAVAKQALGLAGYGDDITQSPVPPPQQVTLCYGARTAAEFAGIEDFRATGMQLKLCTDDGSQGHHGLVTELLEQTLDQSSGSCQVLCCGPEPMMRVVSEIAARREVDCQVSLETPMACGIGICFTCVAEVWQADGTADYKRTCMEGPVFEARQIKW